MRTHQLNKKISNSPMKYFISEKRHEQAVLFVHAAFANHSQYDKQIDIFSQNYTVIT